MADNINKSSILDFGEPEKVDSIIKVIGVGGGGAPGESPGVRG